MADRKWEDLPGDCLVQIFVRVGLVSLVEAVSIVCKSWYKTSVSPLCWQTISFPRGRSHDDEAFVKFAIGRSKGLANGIGFQSSEYMTQEVLDCISDGCPSLKWLDLPSYDNDDDDDDFLSESLVLSSSFCKWKDLESLRIGEGFSLAEIIPEISIHCKNFVWLSADNVNISQSVASAIANLLPNIKRLSLWGSRIERSDLLTIMKGCKNLENLELRFCTGFDVDEEILNLAAHVATVNFEGSTLNHYDSYDDEPLCSGDVDFYFD